MRCTRSFADFDAAPKRSVCRATMRLAPDDRTAFMERARTDMCERPLHALNHWMPHDPICRGQGPFMRAYHCRRCPIRRLRGRPWAGVSSPAVPYELCRGGLCGRGAFVAGGLGLGCLMRLAARPRFSSTASPHSRRRPADLSSYARLAAAI